MLQDIFLSKHLFRFFVPMKKMHSSSIDCNTHCRESILSPLRIILLGEVILEKLLNKLRKFVFLNGFSNLLHQAELKGHVVNRQQRAAGRLLVSHQRVKVRSGNLFNRVRKLS